MEHGAEGVGTSKGGFGIWTYCCDENSEGFVQPFGFHLTCTCNGSIYEQCTISVYNISVCVCLQKEYHEFVRNEVLPMFKERRFAVQREPTFRASMPNNSAIGKTKADLEVRALAGDLSGKGF